MRTLILLSLFVARCAFAGAFDFAHIARVTPQVASPAGGITYLINQNFESGSASVPTEANCTWDVGNNTVTWNYTNVVLSGSYSMRPDPNWGQARATLTVGQTNLYLKTEINVVSCPSSSSGNAQIVMQAGSSNILSARFYKPAGSLFVSAVGQAGTNTLAATSQQIGVKMYCWLDFISGGTCTLSVSTNSTKPAVDGSGSSVITTTCIGTNITRIIFTDDGSTYSVFDNIQASPSVL